MYKLMLSLLLILMQTAALRSQTAESEQEYSFYYKFGIKPIGVGFSKADDLNSSLSELGYPTADNNDFYFTGINYTANLFPVSSASSLKKLMTTVELRLPILNETYESSGKRTRLMMSSILIENIYLSDLFGDYAYYPILGIGLGMISLDLSESPKDNITAADILAGRYKSFEFSKYSLFINLGAGFDYRFTVSEDLYSRNSITLSVNARYSLPLNSFAESLENWHSSLNTANELKNFDGTGLNIDFILSWDSYIKFTKPAEKRYYPNRP